MSKHQEIIDWLNGAPIEQLSLPEVQALLKANPLTRITFVTDAEFWNKVLELDNEVADTDEFVVLNDENRDLMIKTICERRIKAKIDSLSEAELLQLARLESDALKASLIEKVRLESLNKIDDSFASEIQREIITSWVLDKIKKNTTEDNLILIINATETFDVDNKNSVTILQQAISQPQVGSHDFTDEIMSKVVNVEFNKAIKQAALEQGLYLWAKGKPPADRTKNILLLSEADRLSAVDKDRASAKYASRLSSKTVKETIARGYAETLKDHMAGDMTSLATSAFETDKKNIKKLQKDIVNFKAQDATIRSRLIEFNKISSYEWLSPLYSSTLLTNDKIADYKMLQSHSKTIVDNLKEKEWQLNFYLNSLPSDANSSIKSDVDSRRNMLNKSLEIVKAELNVYEPALAGLNIVIPQAERVIQSNSKESIIVSTIALYRDRLIAERNTVLDGNSAKALKPVNPDDANIQLLSGPGVERSILPKGFPQIPKGHFREYVVHDCDNNAAAEIKAQKGIFIEETKAVTAKLVNQKAAHQVEPLVLTSIQWPTDEAAKVDMAMAMAAQLLVSLKTKPSKAHPIVISRGGTPEQAKYLWTALMVIGENDPNMRFDKSAIQVNRPDFSSKSELGFFNRFRDDSCFKTVFEKYDTAKALAEVKAVNAARYNSPEQKKLDFAAEQQLFKQTLGKMVDKMDEENVAQIRRPS